MLFSSKKKRLAEEQRRKEEQVARQKKADLEKKKKEEALKKKDFAPKDFPLPKSDNKKEKVNDVPIKKEFVRNESLGSSMINTTTFIDGEVDIEEDLHLFGKIKGKVKAKGNLTVNTGGNLESSNIEVNHLKVMGKVKGNAKADRFFLGAKGSYEGELNCERLVVEEGALFSVKVNTDESYEEKEEEKSVK